MASPKFKNKSEVPSTMKSINLTQNMILSNAKSKKAAQTLTAYFNSLQDELDKVNKKYEDL